MPAIEEKLNSMGLSLPPPPRPVANYVTAVRVGNLVFVAGHVPRKPDGSVIAGKLGREMTVEQGYEAARLTALNLLSSLKSAIGDLDKVKRIVRLLCMVNCTEEFGDQPRVANGASDLLVSLFGEKGRHARAAVGMQSLPLGACVEIEMVAEVE